MLDGDNFQHEVSALLARNFIGFQSVPDKPSGDGGVDGLSHQQTVGYCCYGLELSGTAGQSAATLKQKICKKFKEDLRRVFELDLDPKGNPVQVKNEKLELILAPGKKIKQICNWFEDNTIIGTLNEAFEKYKAASTRRFVDDNCTLTIMGPSQLVSVFHVDDQQLVRLEQPQLLQILNPEKPKSVTPSPPDLTEFDGKIDALHQAFPKKATLIKKIRDDLLSAWSQNLQTLEELNNQLPELHKKFVDLLQSVAQTAQLESLQGSPQSANQIIESIKSEIAKRLVSELNFPYEHANDVAAGAAAKLVGECPIDWRT